MSCLIFLIPFAGQRAALAKKCVFPVQLAGNAVDLRAGGYERTTLAEKVSVYRYFRAGSMTFVRVWLRRSIGHLLVERESPARRYDVIPSAQRQRGPARTPIQPSPPAETSVLIAP
jgi:hypothetical protein